MASWTLPAEAGECLTVGGSVIGDHDLYRRVGLRSHAADRFIKAAAHVEAWDDDGNKRIS